MSIEKKCMECSVIIVDEWFFGCSGYLCNNVIGYNCAAANATKLLKKYPNDLRKGMKLVMDHVPGLRWFCTECVKGLNNELSNIEKTLKRVEKLEETHLDHVLKRIDKLEETFKTMVQAMSSSSISHEERRVTRAMTKASAQADTFSPKIINHIAPLNNSSTINEAKIISPPTPVKIFKPSVVTVTAPESSSKSDSNGFISKENEVKVNRGNADDFCIRVAQPRRWLFVSRIHNTVADTQVRKLLTKIVDTDDLFVQRIVPKAKQGIKYDYISYKINIPGEAFQNAITSTLWPQGLLVKEFDWSQKKAFFQQPGIQKQIQ